MCRCTTTHTYFYPRSPCGERPYWSNYHNQYHQFLSTLSLRRATLKLSSTSVRCPNFYPRSPCGERLSNNSRHNLCPHFYPRSPCGERPLVTTHVIICAPISIHALLAESDGASRAGSQSRPHFYPRSPCGERHCRTYLCCSCSSISIHALLAESDVSAKTTLLPA